MIQPPRKPIKWVGSSKKDLKEMPEDVQDVFGFALGLAQAGQKHDAAKPLKGFGSAGVLEVVESDEGGTYRAVYTVRLDHWITGSTFCTASRKNRLRALRHPNQTST